MSGQTRDTWGSPKDTAADMLYFTELQWKWGQQSKKSQPK